MLREILSQSREFYRLERAQWLSAKQLEEMQWNRFKRILKHAYEKTPFYRERLRAAGIKPSDIREKNDLVQIPLTTREDLRNPERFVPVGYKRGNMRWSMTSGSFGRRTTTYFDNEAWLMGRYLLKIRARIACGLKPWDKIAIFSEGKVNHGRFRHRFLRKKVFSILEPLESQLSQLEAYNPTAIYGFPSVLSLLARENLGVHPSLVFTSSEMLDSKTRTAIERAFKARVFDVFGCTEVKEISWECPEHCGYHINTDWLLVEFIKNEKPVTEADASIIVSSLYNYGMPLIRYEIGDTGKLLSRTCPCGRGLPLMAPLHGRSVDYFVLPDNSLVSPYKMTCAIEKIRGMKQYQIKQKHKDLVILGVVPDDQFGEQEKKEAKQILESLLPRVTVQVETHSHIPRGSNGKYRIVISDLQD